MAEARIALADAETSPAPTQGDHIRAFLESKRGAMLAKLVELAEAGDPRSLQLALSYLSPPAKAEAERVVIPGLREAPTLALKSEAVINAVARGEISTEAGERVARLLSLHTQAVTVQQLALEVEALKRGAPLPLAQRLEDLA